MAGLRDFLSLFRRDQPSYLSVSWGPDIRSSVLGMSVDDLWRTQPYLRTVVSFLARNVAQLGLHVFERVSDTDRQRLRDEPIAKLLANPNPNMTTYELIFALVGDLALYEEAVWFVGPSADTASGWILNPIPPAWITARGGGTIFAPAWIEVQAPGIFTPTRIAMDQLLWFHGWNPGSPSTASSPVEALKQILAEQIHAQKFREQIWQKSGRFGGFLTRPAGAKWEAGVREKFQRQWNAKYSGDDATDAGGTPILEDGMKYEKAGLSAREEQYVEGSKLALATVASVYHVNPTMVGLLDNANFSNVREFRSMLYGDTLGSIISMIEDRVNTFLVPRITDAGNVYAEFNIAEKLQGSFEETAAALQSSVGAPWLSRNEARAMQNKPAIDGGDELVTPLNVLIGGQASPRDSAPKVDRTVRTKSADRPVQLKQDDVDTAPYVAKAEEVLSKFFRRQQRVVLGLLGAKADEDWWDEERWDRELSDDLYKVAVLTAKDLGRAQASAMGFSPDDYDEDRTLAFLRAVANSRAGAVNSTTRDRVKAALADDDGDPADVFEEAESARTSSGSAALVTALAGFALVEAGKQLLGDQASKTWITGANPRAEHAAMDGETVSLNENFSNGANWPGDPILGADGVAGCNCGVSISY